MKRAKPKPPKPVTLWVDEFGMPVKISGVGGAGLPWNAVRRVRYAPVNRGTAAALKVAVRALRTARWDCCSNRAYLCGKCHAVDRALARIRRKLTGGRR